MKRSMIYGMLVLFLLFMITANPSGTGENGRSFIDWLASGWDDSREFMGSLIGDEEADTNDLGEVPIPTVAPVPTPGEADTAGDGSGGDDVGDPPATE